MNTEFIKKDISQNGQQGAVLVMVVLCLILLIGIVALAVDVGYMYTTRNELQNVADAAALAGARYLGETYSTLDVSQMGIYGFDEDVVETAIDTAASNNTAANESILIDKDNGDIKVGLWDVAQSTDDVYSETFTGPDAVRVVARRDNVKNTPITTFLAGVFNVNTANITSTKAVAALSGPSFVAEGELKTPFGISEQMFPNCTDVISFSPTADSCAGWHNFFDPINANAMKDKLWGLIMGDASGTPYGLLDGPDWLMANFGIAPASAVTPATGTVNDCDTEPDICFEFQGGQIASLFNGSYLDSNYDDPGPNRGNTGTILGSPVNKPAPIIALFDYFRYRDGDLNDATWTATVPVYKDEGETCTNPNDLTEIIGFANIVIYSPDPPPISSIQVYIDCNFGVVDGRGGGSTYGNLKGTIPNLVK